MDVVSLDLFKKHVRADDFVEDDVYLSTLLETAVSCVVRYTGRTMEELVVLGGGVFPVELRHAILLLGGHWYNQRESVSVVQMHGVPDSLQTLLKPFRKLSK